MRPVHVRERCPELAEPTVLASGKNGHLVPAQPADGYPPGDREQYMTCTNCGQAIWGFYVIEEFPY